ncbi:hypothetical protein [Nocardia miyunensis]|uniref:hypothetical protein n=1 Tax=Nocardia miyunensis TaxID=282684 RepID=UPI000AF892BB|nr:hypothetical protein [Nocardia miyunensis]
MKATGMADFSEKTRWQQALLRETRAGVWIDYRDQLWHGRGLSNLTEEELAALRGDRP